MVKAAIVMVMVMAAVVMMMVMAVVIVYLATRGSCSCLIM